MKEEYVLNKYIDFGKVIKNQYIEADQTNVLLPLRLIDQNKPFELGILEEKCLKGLVINAYT